MNCIGKYEAFPFKASMFKVNKQAYLVACDAQVVKHLPAFMWSNPIYRFGVHNQLIEDDEIRDVVAGRFSFVYNSISRLLYTRDGPDSKFNAKAVFVYLLIQSVTTHVQYFERTINHVVHFLPKN